MRRRIPLIILSLMMIFSFVTFCDFHQEHAVTLSQTSIALSVGQTQSLKLKGTSKTGKASSTNKKIATVSNQVKTIKKKKTKYVYKKVKIKGKWVRKKVKKTYTVTTRKTIKNSYVIKGVKQGIAVIKVVLAKKTYRCTVNVFEPSAVSLKNVKLSLDSLTNARDLGGYRGAKGVMKKGRLYRSGECAFLSDQDGETLKNTYHLKTIIDLRSEADHQYCQDAAIEGVEHVVIPLSINQGDKEKILTRYQDLKDLTPAQRQSYYASHGTYVSQNYYRKMAFESKSQLALKEFFRVLLQQKSDDAVLFHCVYGKDRTGFAAMMTLLVLGIDDETALNEFALSNDAYREILGTRQDTGVRKSDMKVILKEILKEYESYQNYFTKAVHLSNDEIKQLQKLYLA